ncbi:MAG: SPOR domain-containing protein [Balneolaceae bacterium]
MKYILPFLLLLVACSSSEPVIQSIPIQEDNLPTTESVNLDDDVSSKSEEVEESNSEIEYPYLSSLSDTYFNRQNEIPKAFSRIKKEIEEKEVDLFEGYRVQIFSGLNPALADTAAKRFRAWSAANIQGYQAETYTFFKAPYYRVHVGDFHDRIRAIEFSNLLKRRFRDSWVVYDRVNPYNVPADTVFISLN